MSRLKVIFLGGVHGVGKSTLAKELATAVAGETISASQLIKEARQGNLTWDSEKRVSAIAENQKLLVAAFVGREWGSSIIILDGHFTLKDTTGEIERISLEVFEALSPLMLVVLTDNPDNIASRLEGRDGLQHDVSLLKRMQVAEKEHAQLVGVKLGVDVIEMSINGVDGLVDHIKQFLAMAD